jgi:hypothetical protein
MASPVGQCGNTRRIDIIVGERNLVWTCTPQEACRRAAE